MWAVAKPDEGITVTELDKANQSRLCCVKSTKRQALRAAIRIAKADILHWAKETQRSKAKLKTLLAELASCAK